MAEWRPRGRGPIQYIADAWSALAWKKEIEDGGTLAKTWVGDHARRLSAYVILRALASNSGRYFLNIEDPEAKRKHREYGDAHLIIEAVRSAVTGDDISLGLLGIDPEKDEVAAARLAELEVWNDQERFNASVIEVERDTLTIGDGVYHLWADPEKERVRLQVYDAGTYFPVLDPNQPYGDFPRTVHVAWEYEFTKPDGSKEPRIRRKTWELAPIQAGEDGSYDGLLNLDTGRIARRYPYAPDDLSYVTCYYTDAIWTLDGISNKLGQLDVESFDVSKAIEVAVDTEGRECRRLDLQQDYIPIIHLPNTVAIKDHFGQSILMAISQILQDLAVADTAAVMAADLAGTPMIGVEGEGPSGDMEVAPGQVIHGKMTPLDLSAALTSIMAYIGQLSKRMTTNARVADAVLGRIEPGEIKSGLHYALMFGPMRSLIEELRLVRAEKYPLLYRFAQRMSISHGWMTGPVQPVTVKFGSYLPSDQAAVIEATTKLWQEKLISRATALQMLVDEGIVDVDVSEELKAVEREDFEAALSLLEALGSGDDAMDEVWKLLGKTRPEQPEVVEPVNPIIPLVGATAGRNGNQEER